MEIFPHLADISDMQEKSLHIPNIEALCGKTGLTLNTLMKLLRKNGDKRCIFLNKL